MTGPALSNLGPYYMRIRVGKYERPKPFSKSTFADQAVYMLPLPSELRDDTGANWSSSDLETVGDVLNGSVAGGIGAVGLRNSGNIAKAAGGLLADALGAAMDTVGANPGGIVDKATGAVGDLFPAERITSAIQAETGLAPNPNPVVTFQGPQLRDFTFTWAFYPKNATESKNIKRMIDTLKARSQPQNYMAKTASVLQYPSMVQLNFFPWDKSGSGNWGWSENSIIRIKRCVMTAVNANYAPYGTPGFFAGTNLPTSISLTIGFKELEYILANDWDPALEGTLKKAVDGVVGTAKNVIDEIQKGIADL